MSDTQIFDQNEVYTIKQVAEKIGVSHQTIRLLIWDGKIKSIKVGGKTRTYHRIQGKELNQYFNNQN